MSKMSDAQGESMSENGVAAVALVVFLVLCLFTAGDPDLIDAIVYRIMNH